MGRQQTVRQSLRQPVRSQQVNASKSSKALLQSILWLFRRHTALMWLAIWAVLAGATTAALMVIVNPDASVRYGAVNNALVNSPANTTTPASTLEQTTPAQERPNQSFAAKASAIRSTPPSDNASPLFAVGAIMLSCAAGCFWLSQCLKPQSRRTQKSSKFAEPQLRHAQRNSSFASVRSPNSQPPQSQTQVSVSPLNPTKSEAQFPSPLSEQSQLVLNTNLTSSQQQDSTSLTVNVVPKHQSHPLDWDEPSLADILDIRQRRSLSDWLWKDF